MKSFFSTGIVLFMTLGWAASPVNAQSDGYGTPSLLPLPSAAPVQSQSVPAGYYYYRNNVTASNVSSSSLSTRQQIPNTVPPPDAQGQSVFDQATQGSSCGECNTCNPCNPSCCRGHWFGAVGGLVMTRNRANPFWTTFETNVNTNQLMNTQNAEANWAGGGQATAGYCWCCGTGLAFTYWGLGPMTGTASITDPNNQLSTPINLNTQFGPVRLGDPVTGTPASFYFDSAHSQQITRNDQINNFEINLLQTAFVTNNRMQLTGLVGFRYFRFDERLSFGAVSANQNFGDNGGADEAYLNFRTTNNLFGGQVGVIANFPLTQRLGIFIIPKGGIFGNQMTNNAHLFSGDGLQGFNISSTKSDVSFLAEIDTGLSWAFTPNFRAFFGYRVVGISNIALADNQFLPFLADQQGFGQIKQNGGLILHGGFAGIAWVF